MQQATTDQQTKWLYLFIGLAVFLNFSGMFVTVMGPDGALYASIARRMAEQHNFADLFSQGKDWLDKPHFPFWITALSFQLFGVTTWAYKLPGILFILLAGFYTYKLGRELYGKQVGLWATLMLLTAQHILICTMDVRAEPFLTGLIIASVYHFYKSLGKQWFWQLVVASIFAACAVMTKGIFALIPIGGAVAGELLIKRNWAMVFNFRWLLALLLILVFITPELYTLYLQFDLHPEKVVFGHQHTSGIKFFFWDSQFGRFFNSGPIKKANGDPFFFLHTILWAYLPWSLLFYTALYQFFRKYAKRPKSGEWFCVSGALATLLVFSLSKFQLPFYITIVFPFFSIICAQYIVNLTQDGSVKAVRIVQAVIGSLMVVVIALLHYFFRAAPLGILTLILMLLIGVLFVMVSRAQLGRYKIFLQCCTAVFFVNVYFNLAYYPALLKYQADSEAAFWINDHNPDHLPVVQTRIGFGYGLDFYLHAPLYFFREGEATALPQKPYLLYADQEVVEDYIRRGVVVKRLKTFEAFRISRLTKMFLNRNTRKGALTTTAVVLIN